MRKTSTTERKDVYSQVTGKIIAQLEQGVRPWVKPWNAEHAAGRITRPLRHGGKPYQGVNVLLLWCDAVEKGYNAPIWMTYRQAAELGAQVRKGEHGSLVVYADRFTKTETDEQGKESEREIPFPLRRPRHHSRSARGSRRLSGALARNPQDRQPGHLHCRCPGSTRNRLHAWTSDYIVSAPLPLTVTVLPLLREETDFWLIEPSVTQ